MLGNDIVAWDAAPNRGAASRARFVGRVFTGDEQARIADSLRPDFTLWLLWAVKESVHKARSRVVPALVFSPVSILVSSASGELSSGQALVADMKYFWRAEEGPGWVHAWACDSWDGVARATRRVARLEGDESKGVRRLALELLQDLGVQADTIEGRPPEAQRGVLVVPGLLSLSHDEGYGAVAWLEL